MMDSSHNSSSEPKSSKVTQGSSTTGHSALASEGLALPAAGGTTAESRSAESQSAESRSRESSSFNFGLRPSSTDDRTARSFRIPVELTQNQPAQNQPPQSQSAQNQSAQNQSVQNQSVQNQPVPELNAVASASSEALLGVAPVPPHGEADTISFQDLQVVNDRSSSINVLAAGRDFENEKTVISQRPVAAPHEFYRSIPLAELAEMLEGRNLDHFLVQQIIGGGGMGAVFRGIDQRLDRVVAIKVIPGSNRDPETLRRFQGEAQAAARLDHPNIARVFYVGESEQWNYIVFEYIEGINVRDLVELEGPMSVDDAVFYTRQIAEALQHAHERDVVHRDIKPSNILVTPTGMAKLVDMGLARDTSMDKSTGDQTASGVTLGTFDYISPEQARNPRDADVRSDLYSLGCTLFYMLTGNPPFPEGTALQKLLNHGSLPPPDPRGWREDVSDQLYDIMMKLMAKRPADRYQRPIELVSDLLILAEQENLPRSQGPSTITLNPSISQPTLLETHLPWLVAVFVLLGSTLWLHSQMSLSTGFTFPQINLPAAEAMNSAALPNNYPVTLSTLPAANPNESTANKNSGTGSIAGSSSGFNSNVSTGPNPTVQSGTLAGTSFPGVLQGGALKGGGLQGNSISGSSPAALPGSSPLSSPLTPQSSGASPATNPATNPTTNSVNLANTAAVGLGSGASASTTAGQVPGTPLVGTTVGPALGSSTVTPLVTDAVDLANNQAANPASGTFGASSSGRNAMLEPVIDSNDAGLSSPFTPKPTKLIVTSNQTSDVPTELWEPSLSRAITRLSNNRAAGELEIRGTVVLDRPIEIGSSELTIRGLNSEARIDIPKSVWSGVQSEAGMISIADGSLNLQAIQLRVSFPETNLSAWRVFELDGAASLNCGSVEFTLQSDRVQNAFLISAGDSSGARSNEASAMRLTLNNCMVRGNGSLLRINQTSPMGGSTVQASISNCVVALKGRVVDLLGATNDKGVERIVRFFSDRSTLVAADGFARLEYSGGGKPSVGFSRTSQACVYWSAPDTPHIRIAGGSGDPSDNPDQLLLQGTDNAYDQNLEHLVALLRSNGRSSELTIYNGQQDGWFVERSTERVVRWKSSPQSLNSLMEVRPVDFQLISSHFVPGYRTPSTNTP